MKDEERRALRERLMTRMVTDESGCWFWQGALDVHGYGDMDWRGVASKAHRWTYIAYIGPIPTGLELDHLCRNPKCVNPAHLEPVTHKENVLRGTSPSAYNARKTECVHGHALTPENVRRNKKNHRDCVTCAKRRRVERSQRDRNRLNRNGGG